MIVFLVVISHVSCNQPERPQITKIVFLHHSTGEVIWNGNAESGNSECSLPSLFKGYNKEYRKNYKISDKVFPYDQPYGWKNYPFDYYNIWVNNAGQNPYKNEPTLEILTGDYDVIIFKHCFPVSNIFPDNPEPDINSETKTLANYKLQYQALREKLLQFPDTKFILWTGAAQVQSAVTEEEALRAREFFEWVIQDWDKNDDNIFLWDFYYLETEGGLYFKDEYAISPNDSHPNKEFAGKAVKLLFDRIIDIIENNGQNTTLIGKKLDATDF